MRSYRALGCFLWTIIITMMVIILLLGMLGEAGAQVRTATGTRIPGPTWTPTPTPTATPVPVAPKCEWIQTPWGGSRCDVKDLCAFTLMPMHVGAAPGALYVKLITDKTEVQAESIAPIEAGSKTASITYGGQLKFVEWWVRPAGGEYPAEPHFACYCDEPRNRIVICALGKVREVQ